MRLLAVLMALGASVLAHAAPTVLHVSPAGRDTWSGKLAAANAAKTDGPLASLAGARDAIRKLKAGGALTQPVEVRLRGGVYRPAEMLSLDAQDAGTAECPVTYRAYPGEKPVLSGGLPVTGFKPWRGKIMVADLPAALGDTYFRSLFLDGQRLIRARYPNRVTADPYRKGFLYVRPNCFGEAVGAMHNAGDWLEWDVTVPADGS